MTKTFVVSLFASLALIISACEKMDTVETTYPDFESVIKASAIGKGKWIPKFLPPSATNIRERHNLDTNEIWLSFHFNTTDQTSLSRACQPITARKITYPRKSPGRWWPAALIQNAGDARNGAYAYYQCEDAATLAIDTKKSEAFYWD